MALELSGTEDKTSRSLASILIPMLRLFALGGIFFAPWGGGAVQRNLHISGYLMSKQ